jgi:RNA polymerase sigma-70 factor (ECF subfamily)
MDLELTGSQGGSENDPILHQQIRSALMRLTPEQRQVIVLKYIIGEDNEEIALALKKPVGAVKSLQHRALEALRRLLLPKE